MECQICYETVAENNLEILECAHGLCKKCYALLRTRNCPFCRTPIIKITTTPINIPQLTTTVPNFIEEELEYESHIQQSTRFRRQRRRDRELRQRIQQQATNNIPTSLSEYEIDNITQQISTSPITTTIQNQSISDKRRQKYRSQRNISRRNYIINYKNIH